MIKKKGFRKSVLAYFGNRKKPKSDINSKNEKIKRLIQSLTSNKNTKNKKPRNVSENENRFLNYYINPISMKKKNLSFKPFIYDIPEIEKTTPVSKTQKSNKKNNNITEFPINKNKEKYVDSITADSLNSLRKSINALLQKKERTNQNIIVGKKFPIQIQSQKEILSNKAKFLYQEPEKNLSVSTKNITPEHQYSVSHSHPKTPEHQYPIPSYNSISNMFVNLKKGITHITETKVPKIFNHISSNNKTTKIKKHDNFSSINNTKPITQKESITNQEIKQIQPNNKHLNQTTNKKIINLEILNEKMNSFVEKHFSLNKRYQKMNFQKEFTKIKGKPVVKSILNNQKEIPTIPGLQHGGIVNKPTPAIIGEAGPEVAAPLKELPGIIAKSQELQKRTNMPTDQANRALLQNDALKSANTNKTEEKSQQEQGMIISNTPITSNSTNVGLQTGGTTKFERSLFNTISLPDWRSRLG